jgi:hypothetical protein
MLRIYLHELIPKDKINKIRSLSLLFGVSHLIRIPLLIQ